MPDIDTSAMSDTPLVREPRPTSRRPLIIGVAALVLIVAAAISAWWYFTMRTPPVDWARVPAIGLLAPAGDAFAEGTPWVTLQLEPARPEQANTLRLSLLSLKGTPIAGDAGNPKITAVTARPVGGDGTEQQLVLQPEPNATGALAGSASFDRGGWWRLSATVEGTANSADFYLLLPDPNINGPGAVASNGSSTEGEALYQSGLQGITALKSVRYTQWLADGQGHAGVSEHIVSAGDDDSPPGFVYRAAGGMEAIVIGSTRWIHLPGDLGWTEQEGAASVPPSQWGEEYSGATGFTILGEETVDGASTQILSFVVPEIVEPRRQTAAWYLWWVDIESGHVRREAMVSRVHYMLNRFGDFDAPVVLEPPVLPATPGTGTPSAATPRP
jgi:hypothetical protein